MDILSSALRWLRVFSLILTVTIDSLKSYLHPCYFRSVVCTIDNPWTDFCWKWNWVHSLWGICLTISVVYKQLGLYLLSFFLWSDRDTTRFLYLGRSYASFSSWIRMKWNGILGYFVQTNEIRDQLADVAWSSIRNEIKKCKLGRPPFVTNPTHIVFRLKSLVML